MSMSPVSPPRGLGKAVLALIGLRLLLVPVFYASNMVLFRTIHDFRAIRNIVTVEDLCRGALTAIVALLFMIWIRAEIVALNAGGIQTRTSPLMAILGWFIPFGNLVLPVLGAREVYKLRLPGASSALPIVWWLAYLASTITAMVATSVRLPFPIAMVTTLVAFGTWFAMVYNVISAPASFGAGPMPYAYAQQPSFGQAVHPQSYGQPSQPYHPPPRM